VLNNSMKPCGMGAQGSEAVWRVLNVSGGKDSVAMALTLHNEGVRIDEVIVAVLGVEFPSVLRAVDKLAGILQGVKFTEITVPFVEGLEKYGWPSSRSRWCTRQKVDKIKKYLYQDKGRVVEECIGFAKGEEHRAERNFERTVSFPLIERGITEERALAICREHGFLWDHLYDALPRLSCYCCPLGGIQQARVVYHERKGLWEEMCYLDGLSAKTYLMDWSVEKLNRRFYMEDVGGVTRKRKPRNKTFEQWEAEVLERVRREAVHRERECAVSCTPRFTQEAKEAK